MKRRIEIISTLIVMILVVILAILLTNKDDNKSINLDNGIAYYYETDSGEYAQGSSNAWSTGEYVLDIEDSSCNNEYDPVDLIDWVPSKNEVLISSNKNINCTLYFEKKSDQEKFFESLLGQSGEGELLYHNSLLENGANDHGYRYSGNNPNNFICFGPGSEDYNNGGTTCLNGNLYRIIGYVPVELFSGKKENRIKVIKSEYATKDDLGKEEADGPVYYIDSFNWNDKLDNTWGTSTLYQALNSNNKSFLKNLNGEESKIEEVQWNVGGSDKDGLPKAKEVYDEEWNILYGANIKVKAKIGLMYPSDFGFASSKDNWTTDLINYDNNLNRENNWLYNAVDEWTISRSSNDTGCAFDVHDAGYVGVEYNVNESYAVRPVFYLKSSVTLSGGDGTETKPYKVN